MSSLPTMVGTTTSFVYRVQLSVVRSYSRPFSLVSVVVLRLHRDTLVSRKGHLTWYCQTISVLNILVVYRRVNQKDNCKDVIEVWSNKESITSRFVFSLKPWFSLKEDIGVFSETNLIRSSFFFFTLLFLYTSPSFLFLFNLFFF